MTLGGKVLIVFVIVATPAMGLVLTEGVATSAHQTDRQGVISWHQGGVVHGAHLLEFVHFGSAHPHWRGPTFGGDAGGVMHVDPGLYRVRSWQKRCKHCHSRQPTLVGRRIWGCSHRLRVKAGKRTVVRIRYRHSQPCVIHVRPPYRPH